jgi:hypothetical protein
VLGHASAAMTMDLYGHLIDRNLWDAADRLGSTTGAILGRGAGGRYASLFEDDLDDVSDRLDAALLEAAAASVRPEPSAEVIELPDQTA